jgi:tartrate-resistant acid phosphatase type 5
MLVGGLLLSTSPRETSRFSTVEFFVVGDWGREGSTNQTKVAKLMSDVNIEMGGKGRPIDFIVSTGDNFYPNGLNSSNDPLFDASFTKVYTERGLVGVPWYAVLGNHDYGDSYGYCENDQDKLACERSPNHELTGSLQARDGRWYCERNYVKSFGGGLLDVFFIDTSPMIMEYRNDDQWNEWNKYKGGVLEQDWKQALEDLDNSLARSTSKVKIVCGHHPPRSNGDHGMNMDLIEHLEPVLESNGVSVYFSGHDHDLEHLKGSDTNYHTVVSGAGSDCSRGFHGSQDTVFQYPWSGFVGVSVEEVEGKEPMITTRFYTIEHGTNPVYEFSA